LELRFCFGIIIIQMFTGYFQQNGLKIVPRSY
jgi:hypothetical protein